METRMKGKLRKAFDRLVMDMKKSNEYGVLFSGPEFKSVDDYSLGFTCKELSVEKLAKLFNKHKVFQPNKYDFKVITVDLEKGYIYVAIWWDNFSKLEEQYYPEMWEEN